MSGASKKEYYTAYVLDAESRSALLQAFPPAHSDIACHHITHCFGGEREDGNMPLPAAAENIAVVGYHENEGIQVLVVEIDGRKHQTTPHEAPRFYHITLSFNRSAGVSPVHSNDLLKEIADRHGADSLKNLADPVMIRAHPQVLQRK